MGGLSIGLEQRIMANRVQHLTLSMGLGAAFGISPSASAEDLFFDSEGVRIRYVDQGASDGVPIVLIHGFTQSIEAAWVATGVIEALENDYRVIALDMRGHGKSDKPHHVSAYGQNMVDDVVRLLDHLGIAQAHMVGYSMGGGMALRVAIRHPERVASAMPNGARVGEPTEAEVKLFDQLIESLETSGSIRPVLEYFASDGSMSEQQITETDEAVRAANDPLALAAVLRSLRTLVLDPTSVRGEMPPCLCVVGEHDPNRTSMEHAAARVNHLDVQVLDGADHLTAFGDPRMTRAIKSFVPARP